VEESIWEDRVRKNAKQENLGSCHKSQRDIQTVKRKNLPTIKERKRKSLEVHGRSTKERVY